MSKKPKNPISIRESIIAAILMAGCMIILAKLLPMTGMSKDMHTTLSLVLPILGYTSWAARRGRNRNECS